MYAFLYNKIAVGRTDIKCMSEKDDTHNTPLTDEANSENTQR